MDAGHITKLHTIVISLYHREYTKTMEFIDAQYFQTKVFEVAHYQATDDFIFRRDVTEISYGKVLRLAYTALKCEDFAQYLLGLKIVIVKLIGNQWYTYFDRNEMKELLELMAIEYNLEHVQEEAYTMPEVVIGECKDVFPIGFEGMDIGRYRMGSMRTAYQFNSMQGKEMLEKQYEQAVRQGNIYHHIVETDHLINSADNAADTYQFIHLVKLLTAHYATEKAPWSRDLTKQLLMACMGLMGCCEREEFEDMLFRLVSGILRVVIKRLSAHDDGQIAVELSEVMSFLANVFCLDSNEKYLDYIDDLLKVANTYDPDKKFSCMREWTQAHRHQHGITTV